MQLNRTLKQKCRASKTGAGIESKPAGEDDESKDEIECDESDDMAILGDPSSKTSIKCSRISKQQLQDLDGNPKVNDHLSLAKSLFKLIFKDELETRPVDVTCSDSDSCSKEALNKTYMEGIRSKYFNVCVHACV